MIDVNVNYELYDYFLFENDKNTLETSQLTSSEARLMNYAFGLNRSSKRYVLRSSVGKFRDNQSAIVILPKDHG